MNIMLFSDVPPSTNYSAGIVLNTLCGFLIEAGHNVSCFTCMNPELKPQIPEDKKRSIRFMTVDKPNENWGGGETSRVMNKKMAEEVLPGITKEAAGFAKSTGAELIWAVEQGQSMILQVRPLARMTGLPYVIQTWDSPQWWMKANHYAAETIQEVMEEYGKVLQDAECFIAASWVMEKKFKEQYHCKRSKAVVLGMPDVRLPKPLAKPDDEFVIAIAGQIYAIEEFKALISALHLLQWNYGGKKIYVDIYAPYLPSIEFPFEVPGNVRVKGWRPQYELVNELQDADLLYCPYWFDEEFRIISETSFPSKLSTYLSVHRPVVIHAPDYASPAIFIKENKAGYLWNVSESRMIVEEIKKIIDDHQTNTIVENGDRAFREHLTLECMRRDFFEALQLPLPEHVELSREQKPMQVIHVNNVDIVGNRFNGYDMMKACADRKDIQFKQVVLDRMSDDVNVIPLITNGGVRQIQELCTKYEDAYSIHAMIQPFGRLLRRTRSYQDADIVHYHLLHNGVMSFTDLPEMTRERASVLTVHDPWLITGHCIHPMECKQWMTGCKKCKNLKRPFAMQKDQAHLMWRIKQKLFENMDIDLVVASKWMEDIVTNSPITGNLKHVHRIPFGIDLSLFSERINQEELRVQKSINPKNFVVMFRQDASPFKGMNYIIEALKRIPDAKSITVLTVGATGLLNELRGHVGQIIEYAWLTDPKLIAELYSCCDAFLMPSTAEAFGLMAIEAMASRKPIIVFEGTALPEVVHAPDVGISVPRGDSKALAAQIDHLRKNPVEAKRRGEKGRALAEESYQFKDYVNRHVELYREVAERHRAHQE